MALEVTGSTASIRYVDSSNRSPIEFRVNQRITAEILNISGDQVDLSIRGTRVVGRLASGNDASALQNQTTGSFMVKGMEDGLLQLQIVPGQAEGGTSTISTQWDILARNLLSLNGLEINENNILLGRALLKLGLPINMDLLNSLSSALNGLGEWGSIEADMAAMLLSKGMPLSAGSLQLALQQLPDIAEALTNLENQLQQWLQNNTRTGTTRNLVEQSISQLRESLVQMQSQPSDLINQLTDSISVLGKSLEAHIAEMLAKNADTRGLDSSDGLMVLVQLRKHLSNQGNSRLVGEIDKFLDAMRQMQLNNTNQSKDITNPPWLVMDIPLKERDAYPEKANIRIAYRPDENENVIDAENNRLVITMELDEYNSLEVDLSMVGKKVGAWLTVTSDSWRQHIESEMPILENRLEKIGYQMQFAKCEVKFTTEKLESLINARKKIDLEA